MTEQLSFEVDAKMVKNRGEIFLKNQFFLAPSKNVVQDQITEQQSFEALLQIYFRAHIFLAHVKIKSKIRIEQMTEQLSFDVDAKTLWMAVYK